MKQNELTEKLMMISNKKNIGLHGLYKNIKNHIKRLILKIIPPMSEPFHHQATSVIKACRSVSKRHKFKTLVPKLVDLQFTTY